MIFMVLSAACQGSHFSWFLRLLTLLNTTPIGALMMTERSTTVSFGSERPMMTNSTNAINNPMANLFNISMITHLLTLGYRLYLPAQFFLGRRRLVHLQRDELAHVARHPDLARHPTLHACRPVAADDDGQGVFRS